MKELLKTEIIGILNAIQRSTAPKLTENLDEPDVVETSDYKFDIVDSKDGRPLREFKKGTAHYINGEEGNTYNLRIICYDDFLHRFTFDDGKGNAHVSRLKDGVKVSDFIIYETTENKKYFIVHELSNERADRKIKIARKQLSDTLNQLFKSDAIARFINNFDSKLCYLSAKDKREIVSPSGIADAFAKPYKILPEPQPFNYGQIRTYHFKAFETSYVTLEK